MQNNERAPRYVRSYGGEHGEKLEFWVDDPAGLEPATPETVTGHLRAAWEAKANQPSRADVERLLAGAGIQGIGPEGIEALWRALALLSIPRAEALQGKPSEWPASILHRTLPAVQAAAQAYGDELITAAARRDAVADGADHREASRAPLARVVEFLEAAERLAECLPPEPPRQIALWHDDAIFLANVLVNQAHRAGATVGISRPDSKGVCFISAALAAHAPQATPDAVAKVLKRNRL